MTVSERKDVKEARGMRRRKNHGETPSARVGCFGYQTGSGPEDDHRVSFPNAHNAEGAAARNELSRVADDDLILLPPGVADLQCKLPRGEVHLRHLRVLLTRFFRMKGPAGASFPPEDVVPRPGIGAAGTFIRT